MHDNAGEANALARFMATSTADRKVAEVCQWHHSRGERGLMVAARRNQRRSLLLLWGRERWENNIIRQKWRNVIIYLEGSLARDRNERERREGASWHVYRQKRPSLLA